MILIISENHDSQTDMVMDWLGSQRKEEVLRINDIDPILINNITLEDSEVSFLIQVTTSTGIVRTVSSKDIDAIWYRRGDYFIYNKLDVHDIETKQYTDELWSYVKGSNDVVKEFLHKHFQGKQIGNYYDNSTNKLINLELAKSVGLKIPPTLVTSNRNELEQFLNEHIEVITKGLKVNGFQIGQEYSFSCLTSLISPNDFQNIPELFAPSLFQKAIPKLFEIRVFYFRGNVHAVAMMSQNNRQTQLDFRNYDTTKPTRVVPFMLPADLEKKISQFMSASNMSTGSLDFIYSTDGEYYFLEINPVGQFGFISNWCNATLEKVIADELNTLAYGNC